MNAPLDQAHLHDVLERSTNAIESPAELAAGALAGARRRRIARRAVVAVGSAVALVVGIALVGNISGTESDGPPPVAPPDEGVVKARWDPRDVDDLPPAPDGVAPSLPDVIDPPDVSPMVTGSPVDAAVLVVAVGSMAQALSTDGTWRSVPLPGQYPVLALSPQGTRLAVTDDNDAVEVHDLQSGQRRKIPPPEAAVGSDFSAWTWVDEQTLLFTDAEGGWLVDPATSEARRVPFPRPALSWSIDPDGAVVESADWSQPSVLTDWAGGEPRQVSMAATGRLSSVEADAETVAGTAYDTRPFAVVIADRRTLTPRAVLRAHDHEGNYSNGGLSVLALLDDGDVLLRVAVFGRAGGFRIVHWEPETGELSRVSSSSPTAQVAFAQGLIRTGDP